MTRILLYSPVYGSPDSASVSLGYHQATLSLSRSVDVEMLDGRMFTDCDLVRARSRAVRVAIESPNMTHLLHWDADVVGNVGDIRKAIDGMLASGHDLVGCPYPRKRVRWERIAAADCRWRAESWTAAELQSVAYDYPYMLAGEEGGGSRVEVRAGCVEVDAMAFGFTLTSRACLEKMWHAYAPTLSFGDSTDGQLAWTVAMFQLYMPPQSEAAPFAVGPLLSEDYSFCRRWRDIGGTVNLYVGDGSPMHHVGPHVFRGSREGVVMGD